MPMSATKDSLAPDLDIEKLHIIEWDHLDLWRFYPMALASSWTIRSLLYPTQVIKARLQLQQQNTVYRGMTHAFVDIFRKEGFFALYRVRFWVTVPQISATFIYSSVYERLRKELADRANITSPSLVSPLAGAAASLCIELIYVPTDIISQYMMIDKKSGSFTGSSSGAIIDCLRADKLENRLTLGLRVIRAVYKVDGLSGFYRGFWSSCFVYVPSSMVFWSTYYASLNLLKKAQDFSYSLWNKKAIQDSPDQQASVLRIRIQVHRTSYMETFKRLVNIEGFRVFTKGLAPRIISNSIYSSLIMVGYESVKRMSVLPEYKDSVVCRHLKKWLERPTILIRLSAAFVELCMWRKLLIIFVGNIYGGVGNGIEVLVFVLNIVALKKRNPKLYLPSMIFLIISIVFTAIAVIFLFIMFCAQPEWYVKMLQEALKQSEPELNPAYIQNNSHLITGIFLFVLIWSLAISTFTYAMIYRAYVYMKLDGKEKNLLPQ
uniref:Uncharacterized protein n=1 Tax=Ditylenchus dipsaci TaxID=166011 RepID=A0A915E4I0_9BILA